VRCTDAAAVRGLPNPSPRRPRRVAVAMALAAATMALSGCAGPAPAPAGRGTPGAAGAAQPATSWDEYRLGAARRIVAANPAGVYDGPVPDPLLAIPVLELELEADGAIRQIRVLRVPTQAQDTVELAIAAVQRAAPFGPVSQLPRPWKFVEYFLFDDDRRFKPRTLDID
jgi:hypothetical protein